MLLVELPTYMKHILRFNISEVNSLHSSQNFQQFFTFEKKIFCLECWTLGRAISVSVGV